MTTVEDQRVYDAQALAFEGTPLGDHQDRTSLMRETLEIASHPSVVSLVGSITVHEGRADMVNHAAYAQLNRIVFQPNDMSRFVAVHELAHIVHRRSGLGGRSHGAEYRAMFAELTAMTYGDNYGRLLREAFYEDGLEVHHATLHSTGQPVIHLDALADATRESRWL